MSLVERLAKKWDGWCGSDEWLEAEPKSDARWWLNAIADELEEHLKPRIVIYADDTVRWLRSQANPDSAESE